MADVAHSVSREATFPTRRHPSPDAASEDITSEDAGEATPTIRSSLDVLARLSSDRPATLPTSPAALSTSLPASDHDVAFEYWAEDELPQNGTAGYQHSDPTQTDRPESGEEMHIRSFTQRIHQLQESLPHLNNIKYASRRQEAKVDCYDFSREATVSSWHAAFRREFNDYLTDDDVPLNVVLSQRPPSGTDLRLIVIEDMSLELLKLLDSLFDMSLEAFEEHLLNSGWRDATHVDQTEDSWITRNMAKDYVSMKWHRPVRRRLSKPSPCADRSALLDPREPKRAFKWTQEVFDATGEGSVVEHSLLPLSNVFRECWDIQAEVSQSKDSGNIVLCEERATIWSQQREDYRIVIALLDPLPKLSDTVTGTEEALESLGLLPLPEGVAPITTPIGTGDANNRDIVTEPRTSFISKRVRVKRGFRRPQAVFDWFVSGLQERYQNAHSTQHPTDPENAMEASNRQSEHSGARSSLQVNESRSLDGSAGAVRGSSSEPIALSHAEQDFGVEMLTLYPVEQSIYKGFLPRGPPLSYRDLMSAESLMMLKQHLHTKSSTSEDFARWIHCRSEWENNVLAHSGPIDCLFAIIQNDIMNTLRLMNQALTQIGQHALDNTLIQQRLINWRSLLDRFDTDLRTTEESIRSFAQFISSLNKANHPRDPQTNVTLSPLVKDLQQTCVISIANLRQRTQSSYQSLMTSMSIVESKRGIAEAESITKLTELAFFFIPLTFSATIFSMQVKELSATNLSVSTFIILALIVTFLSYGLRLLTRSQAFSRRRRAWAIDIRTYNHLAAGAQISNTSFLLWFWRRIGLSMVVAILAIALIVAPTVALWTSGISRGLKAVLTVFLLVLAAWASVAIRKYWLHIRAGGLHFQPHMFKI